MLVFHLQAPIQLLFYNHRDSTIAAQPELLIAAKGDAARSKCHLVAQAERTIPTGGNPSGIRWINGDNGVQKGNQWLPTVKGGYGNTSSADYFAEAFSWTIVDASKVPSESIVNWINARIVLTYP